MVRDAEFEAQQASPQFQHYFVTTCHLLVKLNEITSKYCILDSFVDHDGYSISSEGFLSAVVDIMVI